MGIVTLYTLPKIDYELALGIPESCYHIWMESYFSDLDNNFYRTIADGRSLKIEETSTGIVEYSDDPARKYFINTYGFRGPEFSSDSKMVVAGCSFTYGLGVPEETVWGNVVSNKLNISQGAAVAKPGASISWIVEKLFAYFYEFGNPEYLLCLMPDPHRFIVPLDGKILDGDPSAKKAQVETGTFGVSGQRFYSTQAKQQSDLLENKYLKRPYNIRNLYTPELTLYQSIRALRMLEQYCNVANIKFIWSTWDRSFMSYLEKINESEALKFKNFFSLNLIIDKKKLSSGYKYVIFEDSSTSQLSKYNDCMREHKNMDCSCDLDCHQDLENKYGKDNFVLGTDLANGQRYAHPGTHVHAHYAEKFIEELLLRYPYGLVEDIATE